MRKRKNPREIENDPSPVSSERFEAFYHRWKNYLNPEHPPHSPSDSEGDEGFSFFLLLLKVLPYLSFLAFLVSLGYDFTGEIVFPWVAEPVSFRGLLRMVSVSALIGFGTNWVAIKMLFFPRERRPLLGQGLIPAKKESIVERLGDSIASEIINPDLILEQVRKSGLLQHYRTRITDSMRNLLSNDEFRRDVVDLTQYYVNAFLRSKSVQSKIREFVDGIDFEGMQGFEAGVFRIYRMLKGRDMSERIKEIVRSVTFDMSTFEERLLEFLSGLPDSIEENSDSVEEYTLKTVIFLIEKVNIRKVISDNLRRFDERRLENLLLRTTSDQLQYIQYLGCLLGILGGLFIWRPVESFLFFVVLAIVIGGLDEAILRYRVLRKKDNKKEATFPSESSGEGE